jgi:hypothetical protein
MGNSGSICGPHLDVAVQIVAETVTQWSPTGFLASTAGNYTILSILILSYIFYTSPMSIILYLGVNQSDTAAYSSLPDFTCN